MTKFNLILIYVFHKKHSINSDITSVELHIKGFSAKNFLQTMNLLPNFISNYPIATLDRTAAAGIFDLDVDANGRWSVEKFKGLMFQIEQEANAIAKGTRRGKGNMVICSSDVASALQMAGVLDYTPALNSNALDVDDTGNTFAGVLNGRYRVYIDPYATGVYVTVGYKGTNPYDAGMFYCPYVPLQMVRAVGEDTFQPRIGFKTRYGMVTNPFVGTASSNNIETTGVNQYYRIFEILNLHGQQGSTP